ncbi:MAG: glycerol-3-phosphate acyltransferase, partial [Pseudomonadota bacterium]
MPEWAAHVLALSVGYFVGAIPFGLVLTRAAGLGDIRKIGSGNIGATNVLRTGRKDLALATLFLDMFKAGIVALLFWKLFEPSLGHDNAKGLGMFAGAAAFVGH